jgi:hypothetical protein
MIVTHPILIPVLTLIAWTMIIWTWMMATRWGAFKGARIDVRRLAPGTRGPDLDARLDRHAQWKAHNYNHLLEQPTAFYALCVSLALLGLEGRAFCLLAWSYVALRIAHSLVQATHNIVHHRAILFALSSFCLLALTIMTLLRVA